MPKQTKTSPSAGKNNHPILIVGAVGSGGKTVAKCLDILGYKTHSATKKTNEIRRLNDRLLSAVDMSWSNPRLFSVSDQKTLKSDKILSLTSKTLQDNFFSSDKTSAIALEDPRMSLLLPAWINGITEAVKTNPAVILCLRHPFHIAKKLAAEKGFGMSHSLSLWLRYTLEAEKASRGLNRCVILWETLVSDPQLILKKTANDLKITWPKDIGKTEKKIGRIFSKYSGEQEGPAKTKEPLNVLAQEVFSLLSKESLNSADKKTLDRIKNSFDKQDNWLNPMLTEMDAVREHSNQLNARLTSLLGVKDGTSSQNDKFKLARAEMQRDDALAELASLEEILNAFKLKAVKPSKSIEKSAAPAAQTNTVKLLDILNDTRKKIAEQKSKNINVNSIENLGRRFRPLTPTEKRVFKDAIDSAYYIGQAQELGIQVKTDPVLHYLREGAWLGLSPHPLFDPEYYTLQLGDVIEPELPLYADFIITRGARGIKPHPFFDPDYYLQTNPDVARAGMLPHIHFQKMGWKEARKPNAWFYPIWYISQNDDVLSGGNPILQYASLGERQGYQPHPSFNPAWYRETYLDGDNSISPLRHYLESGESAGNLTQASPMDIYALHDDTRFTLLCVAHSASERIYGSERSFLDVLSSIDRTKYRIVVLLPQPKAAYVELVQEYADIVLFTKRHWWSDNDNISDETVREIEKLIETQNIDAVYANTIVLREPLIAARNKDIPAICHIREAIIYDEHLCEEIGLSAGEIIEQVRNRSDYLIANSQIMVDMYGGGEKTHLVYNAVNVSETLGRARWRGRGHLILGTLSSNLPKKGIEDVVKLAEAAQKEDLNVSFKIFGPMSDEAQRLKKYCRRRRIENVEFSGYAEDARQAINQIDVVLNFSHFAESFGRTIAEAGAAARPAIVYNHGALPEVVSNGVSGVVIPYLKPLEALGTVKRFIEDPEYYYEMGRAARKRAEDLFSHRILAEKINATFDHIRGETESKRKNTSTVSSQPNLQGVVAPVTVIIPNYNYEDYLPERIQSILNQTRPPAEIIFLDDASPDNSVAVAEEILSKSDIPYKILASHENLGVYKQWLRGLAETTQPWVWIAEADDSAEPNFLEELLKREDPSLNIIYAQSRKIDGEGNVTAIDNRAHTNAISPTRWARDFVSTGVREVVDSLAFRNSIPNASAVLLRRSAIDGLEEKLLEMNYTGDWLLYAHMLRTGGLAFVSSPLNHFRRHQRSVTITRGKGTDYLEELSRIRLYMAEHFPLRLEDFGKMNAFLDKDYKINGVAKNSEAKEIAPLQAKLRETLAARKRIGIITTNNGSYYGGSEMLWRETALKLREDGHDIVILIKRWEPRPEFFDDMEAAGITLLFKEEDGFTQLRALRPDLTIVSIGDQDEGIEFYPDLKRADLPYVIVNQLTKEARFWPIRQAKTKSVTEGYVGAEKAFFTSWNNHRVMEDRLAAPLPNGALHFNPYHIDRSIVPAWPSTDAINIAIPSKLLFIHKGQDILTEFLGKPEWQKRDIVFNFYGIGPDEDNLLELARKNKIDNFVLHGRVSDISEIWKLNQALLMPSRMEGLPIMLVSAMLSGRVPIVTDIGGHAEVVTDNISGFIAADPIAKDVEDALIRALTRQNEWQKIGQKSREAILDFLPEDPIDDFIKKLMRVIKSED